MTRYSFKHVAGQFYNCRLLDPGTLQIIMNNHGLPEGRVPAWVYFKKELNKFFPIHRWSQEKIEAV